MSEGAEGAPSDELDRSEWNGTTRINAGRRPHCPSKLKVGATLFVDVVKSKAEGQAAPDLED